MRVSSRMLQVQSPIIPVVGELIRQHPGTISLGQGIVHYGPSPAALKGIDRFLADEQNHKYKLVGGIPELLDVLANKLLNENGIVTGKDGMVFVTAGGNMAFMNAVLAVADEGDEVILQNPNYFNHEMAITMAGCKPVLVQTDAEYQLRPDAIASAITPRTRAVVTISPNNPTGVVYPEVALRQVNALCKQAGVYHIHDEAYEYFIYGGCPHFSPGSIANSFEHTISLFSMSKAYGMASWRIGFMIMPTPLLTAVKKIQDTILICPPAIGQFVAAAALQEGSKYCREKIRGLAEVRQRVRESLLTLGDRITLPPADGALYFFPQVHTRMIAMDLVERLVREFGVAVIPGNTFGMNEGCHLRVAYGALSGETVVEGIGRLVRGLRVILG